MVLFVITMLLFVCGASLAQPPPTFPNIDYLSLGYNIFYGNPHANGGDPGFYPVPLFDLSYKGGMRIGSWSIPDGVTALDLSNCHVSGTATTIESAFSYQATLSIDAQTDLSYLKAKFSASTDYQSVSKATGSYNSVFTSTSAICYTYRLFNNNIYHPNISTVFINQGLKLPTTFNPKNAAPFWQFFESMGTHFLTDVKYGSRWGYLFESSQEQWATFQKLGINVAVAASYAGAVTAGISLNSSYETQLARNFTSLTTNTETYSAGVPPPASADASAWLTASLTSSEMSALSYSLVNISELFGSDYTDDTQLQARQQAVAQALLQYCPLCLLPAGAVSSCDGPPTPPPPPAPVGWAALVCGNNNCWHWSGTIFNAASQNQAQEYAMDGCSGTCNVMASFSSGCMALALSPGGNWKYAVNTDLTVAQQTAVKECGGDCAVAVSGCATATPSNATWGAIGCGNNCGDRSQTTQGYPDRDEARHVATMGLNNNPFIAIDFMNCGALAIGKYGHWGSAEGVTLQDAMNNAMLECQLLTSGCNVVTKACTNA